MGEPTVTETTEAEALRARMNQGSLNLLGVVAALRMVARDLADADNHDTAEILHLLSRNVEAESDAMGGAENFLRLLTTQGAA